VRIDPPPDFQLRELPQIRDARVLVTGATGFLGGHVVRLLRRAGATAIAAARALRSEPDASVHLDLDDPDTFAPALAEARPTAVVHCAAYGVRYGETDLDAALRANVRGTIRLFEACTHPSVAIEPAAAPRFVHVGTCYEFGHYSRQVTEDDALVPVGFYGASKAAASLMLRERGRAFRREPVIMRPFTMFGPGERQYKLAPLLVDAIRRKTPLAMTPALELRDYVFVEDVAFALAGLAALDDASFPFGGTFNLCSGTARTVRDFAGQFELRAGAAGLFRFGELPPRVDIPQTTVGSPVRWLEFCTRRAPGLHRELTPFDVAVERTLREA
jgi:nucleoside-diphosphate-sugar epimerase